MRPDELREFNAMINRGLRVIGWLALVGLAALAVWYFA